MRANYLISGCAKTDKRHNQFQDSTYSPDLNARFKQRDKKHDFYKGGDKP